MSGFHLFLLSINSSESFVEICSIVVEMSGGGRAERVPPHRADVGEPNADDPEGVRAI
jgi:hypothetical protein